MGERVTILETNMFAHAPDSAASVQQAVYVHLCFQLAYAMFNLLCAAGLL